MSSSSEDPTGLELLSASYDSRSCDNGSYHLTAYNRFLQRFKLGVPCCILRSQFWLKLGAIKYFFTRMKQGTSLMDLCSS